MDTCFLEGDEGETEVTYVKACGKGKTCTEDDYYGGKFGICVKRKDLLEEDKKCTSPLECRSGICTNKKCSKKKVNEPCNQDSDECGKSAFCKEGDGETGTCKELSGKEGECNDEEHCQIGLTCSNGKCIEKFSLEVGSEADEDNACKTGKSDGNKCVNYTAVENSCTEKEDEHQQKIKACKTKTNDGTSDNIEDNDYCERNWDDKYICPTEKYSKWDKYVEEFKKRYDKLSDDDKKDKYINRDTLNNNKVRDAYAEYYYYQYINFDDDCIKDYYHKKAGANLIKTPYYLPFLLIIIML